MERALTLKEAADLLAVSYSTIYANPRALGFFKVGGVWRIWPEILKSKPSGYNADRPARTEGKERFQCPSESATASITSISVRQAEKKYAAFCVTSDRKEAKKHHDKLKAELWDVHKLGKRHHYAYEEAR
ncbi:helix-turn-helix domain-containing protein [Burkholderia sp. FL-7-2-10-S1-D7]|uniref:helix-turn-helix domain-containing protein n=1 Tax=Burkholderia sp. FL-7-2-10-S1-D7 TaxID=1637866 RepID=UPI0012E344C2|nr:helix-turn-helix domain-containing protein [Burkholderia sp. FL-7-2-10-S1-D7]